MISCILTVSATWLLVIFQTYYHWGSESYYSFGQFVPLLTICLLYLRFRNLPLDPQRNFQLWRIAIPIWLVFLLAYANSEVNPFWRLPIWFQGMAAFGFSLAMIFSYWGLHGLRKAIFPLFFMLTMIPWPYQVETSIVQNLTSVVVSFTLPILNFLGYPVVVSGNSFSLGDIHIGVNEACSGIRSFQSLFMVALFLGSALGHSKIPRVVAVLALPFVVIFINSLRAAFLALVVIEDGFSHYEEWHDPAGYIAFIASMIIIYILVEFFGSFSKRIPSPTSSASQGKQPLSDKLEESTNAHNEHREGFPKQYWPLLLPVFTFLITEGWFRYHESNTPESPSWSISVPPEDKYSVTHFPISPSIQNLLGYDYATRFKELLNSRAAMEVYFYGYKKDNKLASVSSYGHSPLICMNAIGAILIKEFDPLIIDFDSLRIPLKHYLFRSSDGHIDIHVFWVVWENRNMNINAETLASLDYKLQWKQLWQGRRDFSRHVFLASITQVDSPDGADRLMDSAFRRLFTQDSFQP